MLKKIIIILTILLILHLTLQNWIISSEKDEDKNTPASTSPVKFTEISESIGLKNVVIDEGIISWGDYNNDGYQDLLVNGYRLYKNDGPPSWKFTNVTNQSELKTEWSAGSWGDYDNDGNLDIFVFWSKDSLWRNSGPPKYTFANITEQSGDINDEAPTRGMVWFDYDRDGWLDLYAVNYERDIRDNFPDRLLHNEIKTVKGAKSKDRILIDVTEKMGMEKTKSVPLAGRSAAIGDYNNDGFPDIYVSNYRLLPNYLWENKEGKIFEDTAVERGVIGTFYQGAYGHTIASAFCDINNDGLLDLIAGNFAHKDSQRGPYCDDARIYLNLGPDEEYKFRDIREQSGIPIKPVGGEEETICGVTTADFDNDGLVDLYFTQIYDVLPYAFSWLYHNEKPARTDAGPGGKEQVEFRDIAEDAGVRVWHTYISTPIDFDNDGDMDLITGGKTVPDKGAPLYLRFFRNDTNSPGRTDSNHNWLEVALKCKHCNRFGLGARITIYYNDQIQIREIGTAMSNTSYGPYVAHFGLGKTKKIDKMEVRWPCGRIKKISWPKINKIHIIEER